MALVIYKVTKNLVYNIKSLNIVVAWDISLWLFMFLFPIWADNFLYQSVDLISYHNLIGTSAWSFTKASKTKIK